jgi:4-hydroxyphenylpyruvate dioxygenase
MYIDHIHFYVTSARSWRDWFVRMMGFQPIARLINSHTHTEIISNGVDHSDRESLIFVLSSPLAQVSPVAQFLANYPCGIVDVAFRVKDLVTFRYQYHLREKIQAFTFPNGTMKTCVVKSRPNFQHTLIERQGETPILADRTLLEYPIEPTPRVDILGIDHVVLNVCKGNLESTASWYEQNLGFKKQQTFTIQTARSGLYSQVMSHPESEIKFPINEPSSPNSQIQEFLDINKAEGIQHIALKTQNVISLTKQFREAGLPFLSVPTSYYKQLENKQLHLQFSQEEWREIQVQKILIDFENNIAEANPNQNPTLLQIFTQPIFEQPTFFFELIERRDAARGFGEGNFQALFEAIEREQIKRERSPYNRVRC